jgi:hypothetical protein
MCSAGYVDTDNNIIWSADPANTLKPWAYKHLLTIIGNNNAPIATMVATASRGKEGSVRPDLHEMLYQH